MPVVVVAVATAVVVAVVAAVRAVGAAVESAVALGAVVVAALWVVTGFDRLHPPFAPLMPLFPLVHPRFVF